jgi:glyoxylase-like metal-dependent hydrolase (beta-lactamase superfamily II)
MGDYLRSLGRCKALKVTALAPGHGEVIHDPGRVIDWIIEHRLQREARVLAAMRANPGLTTHELVPHVYQDIDPKLHALAERSLLAHVLKLREEGLGS